MGIVDLNAGLGILGRAVGPGLEAGDPLQLGVEGEYIAAGGGAQAAVELRTVSPQYLGAVVVCDGADAPQVQLAVTQAVAQFTGLSTDRISVLKKQPDA